MWPRLKKTEEAPLKDLSFDEKLTKIQKYLPKGLTEKILSQKDGIEGERKQVTVMFCDMEGFTPMSELLGSGDHTLRIQPRQIPHRIDQIWLSRPLSWGRFQHRIPNSFRPIR